MFKLAFFHLDRWHEGKHHHGNVYRPLRELFLSLPSQSNNTATIYRSCKCEFLTTETVVKTWCDVSVNIGGYDTNVKRSNQYFVIFFFALLKMSTHVHRVSIMEMLMTTRSITASLQYLEKGCCHSFRHNGSWSADTSNMEVFIPAIGTKKKKDDSVPHFFAVFIWQGS